MPTSIVIVVSQIHTYRNFCKSMFEVSRDMPTEKITDGLPEFLERINITAICILFFEESEAAG